MKQTIISLLMLLLPLMASAEAVEIDGIYYNLINKAKVAEVTENPNKYAGNVVIPSSVVYDDVTYSVTAIIGAFSGCSGLTSVTIPNSVTSIGMCTFQNCSGLTSITIPNSVTSIEGGAFEYCRGLTSVTIPNSVMSIGAYAFANCSSLTSISIPNSVTSIEFNAFYNCSSLTSITIPNSVTTIKDDTFNGCGGMTNVTIPNSVTSIGRYAFQNCSDLTSITIPNSVTSIDAFQNCSGLTSITIPNSVTSIGFEAFIGCSSLNSITIPNSVTSIEISAFSWCSDLTSVTIGSGVKVINSSAFSGCPELTDVYCYAENVPNTSSDVFDGSYIEHATLHVPASALNDYSNTEPWSNFKNKVGIGKAEKYYALTYMLDGTKYVEFSLQEGETITPESAPSKGGYTFSGWSEIPETMPDHDVTVTGTFIANTYLPGDANGDGQITVTDIGVIVDIILGKTPANARKQQEEEPQ